MKTSNPHSLIGPKALSWLIETELLWLVGKDGNEDIAVQLQLDGESLSLIGQILILALFLN